MEEGSLLAHDPGEAIVRIITEVLGKACQTFWGISNFFVFKSYCEQLIVRFTVYGRFINDLQIQAVDQYAYWCLLFHSPFRGWGFAVSSKLGLSFYEGTNC